MDALAHQDQDTYQVPRAMLQEDNLDQLQWYEERGHEPSS